MIGALDNATLKHLGGNERKESLNEYFAYFPLGQRAKIEAIVMDT